MSNKYPDSGLTDQEARILEEAGWRESAFESLPPPWFNAEGELLPPRKALEKVMANLKATLRGDES